MKNEQNTIPENTQKKSYIDKTISPRFGTRTENTEPSTPKRREEKYQSENIYESLEKKTRSPRKVNREASTQVNSFYLSVLLFLVEFSIVTNTFL